MDVISIFIYFVIPLLTLSISFLIARKYGDVAGTKAAIEYEENKAVKARKSALMVLKNEVTMMQEFAGINTNVSTEKVSNIQQVYSLPVDSIKYTFLSKDAPFPQIQKDELKSIVDFITRAQYINELVAHYFNICTIPGTDSEALNKRIDVLAKIKSESQEILETLKTIQGFIESSLGEMSKHNE